LGADRGLIGAGAGADEACVGARHADRDVTEHADRALQVQHAGQRGGLFTQHVLLAHATLIAKSCRPRSESVLATPARLMRSPQRSISELRNFCSSAGAGLSTGMVPSLIMSDCT